MHTVTCIELRYLRIATLALYAHFISVTLLCAVMYLAVHIYCSLLLVDPSRKR